MIPSFCYLISSNVAYQEPLKRLLGSMSVSHDHFVVIGGCKDTGCVLNYRIVNHDSFDYTALIEFLDFEKQPSHVFLLHDTMEFTAETDALVRSADPEMDATAAVDGCQCNLGLFRTDYLLTKRAEILKMRNCTKLEAVQFEGVLWKDAPKRAVYPNGTVDVVSETAVYGGAIRRTERYNALKLFKHKSSWGQEMETIGERIKP